jgi:hypothetical protein
MINAATDALAEASAASAADPSTRARGRTRARELAEKHPTHDGLIDGRPPKFQQGQRVEVTGAAKDPEGACHGARAKVYGTAYKGKDGVVRQTVRLEDNSIAAVPEEKLRAPTARKSFRMDYQPGQYEAIFGHPPPGLNIAEPAAPAEEE